MTQGVLIFAQNNSEIDYAKLSVFCAKRVREYLDKPVTLVTDSKDWLLQSQPDANKIFDNIISLSETANQTRKFYDGSLSSKTLNWKNLSRYRAYELSPYDQTLVIDSDYILASDNLNSIWDTTCEFLIYKNSYDLAQWRDDRSFRYLNQWSVPFFWATAFYFKKTKYTDAFFKIIEHIKENWSYYRSLHNIDSYVFRNDFAFSIALHLMGEEFYSYLPGKMNYILDRDILTKINGDSFQFLVEKKNYCGEYTALKTSNIDVHIMNKYSLNRCIDGTDK